MSSKAERAITNADFRNILVDSFINVRRYCGEYN
jgi:hypothetical protein